jgi:hypothetical protein
MPGKTLLLSTAYLPPVGYIAAIARYKEVTIEKHETYLKQSYRNRCIIAGANGPQALAVPVLRGSFHKTPVDEVRIDYSRRWVPVHIRSFVSAYRNAPYYDFYADELLKIISSGESLLLNLNMQLLKFIVGTIGIKTEITLTGSFVKPEISESDLRYSISPKSKNPYRREIVFNPYTQLFSDRHGFIPDISIIDLIFNMGPESLHYLSSLP